MLQQEDIRSENRKVHERLERIEQGTPSRTRDTKRSLYDDLEEEAQDGDSTHSNKAKSKYGNLSSIKMKIPTFHGKSDPEAYLEWEKKVERVFECHNYTKEKKVKLAAVEFTYYASVWWDQFTSTRRRSGEGPVSSWFEMKTIMRKRFVPTRYHRNLYNFYGIKRGRGDRDRFYRDYNVRNRGDENVDQNLGGHLKRKHLRYDSNFCSNLESWSDKDDRPINLLPMTPKQVYENPSSQINDIECVECLGYGYDEYECLRGKECTVP